MAETTPQQKLEKLKEQRKTLDARIRKEAAKAGAEGRKRKSRQKYIVGGIVLAALNDNNTLAAQMLALIKSKASSDDLEVLSDALPTYALAQPQPQPQQKNAIDVAAIKNAFNIT